MTAMRAVFRFDASPETGAGHAYRSLTLAETLSGHGWRCHGIVNRDAATTVPALQRSSAITLVNAEDIDTADWLVVDHYGLDASWEAQQRSWAASIMVIDDLADRAHDCDVLLDQTYGRDTGNYGGLVPNSCRRLVGSTYALLRPEFAQARPASLSRRAATGELRRVLVSLGATDPHNHTIDVLRGIAESGLPLAVDVVLGSAARHLEAVREACATLPFDIRLHVDSIEVPKLMVEADLAIGAAGTSTWERCCLGLPSLVVVAAENQRLIAERVTAAGAARLLPGPRSALAEQVAAALQELTEATKMLSTMSAKAAAICDGLGANRVVKVMEAGMAATTSGSARTETE